MLISFAPNTSMPSLFTIFWDKLAVARQSAIPCAGANALFFGAVWLRVFVSHLYSLTCGPHGKVTLSVRDTPLSWCEKYVFSSVLVGRHRTQRYPTRWFVCPWLDGNNYSEMKRHPSNMMHYNVWIPLIQGFLQLGGISIVVRWPFLLTWGHMHSEIQGFPWVPYHLLPLSLSACTWKWSWKWLKK